MATTHSGALLCAPSISSTLSHHRQRRPLSPSLYSRLSMANTSGVNCSLQQHSSQNQKTCETRRVISVSLLLLLNCFSKDARAGNLLDKYVKRKKLDPLEAYVPAVLLSISQFEDLDEWWRNFGIDDLELQTLAIRILSQTCSSSGCERNWSVFERIHTKRRNRLEHKRLNDLVYTHYNLRLKERQASRKSLTDPISLENIDLTDDWVVEAEDDDAPLLDVDEIDDWMDVADAILDEGEGGAAAEKTLEFDKPKYATCRSLLRSGPAASLRVNIRAVAQYASEDGRGKAALDAVDQCLRALEDLDSLLLHASRNDPEASIESMKAKIGIAVGALDSLMQTVPSAVLDKGKAIADAYRMPEDDIQPENLDLDLKKLEQLL